MISYNAIFVNSIAIFSVTKCNFSIRKMIYLRSKIRFPLFCCLTRRHFLSIHAILKPKEKLFMSEKETSLQKINKYKTNKNVPKKPAISGRMLRELKRFAEASDISKIILFGSRAKGNCTEKSDVDIAVSGGNFDQFYFDVQENMHSLLSFDIINLDQGISEELRKEIRKDGITLYEKT